MKKLFAILILVAFTVGGTAQSMSNRSCWDGTVAETYDGGDGTQENPYQIATAEQLALLAQQTNDGTGGNAYYILTDDICLNGSNDLQWIPIGDQGNFTGVFDGNGHTISDMYVSDRSAGGLFARTNTATIKNTAISNSSIQSVNYAGFMVGWAVNTSIVNCSVDGFISYNINASSSIGGVIGYLEVDYPTNIYIRNCVNNATIQANASGSSSNIYSVGGIVGTSYVDMYSSGVSYIVDCCNNGDLMGRGDAGGIVGSNDGYVYYCENYGQISSMSTAGGIVAYNQDGVTKGCHNYATGAVTGNYAGGIVGYNWGWIFSCVNDAPITGYFKHTSPAAPNKAGGILGYGENIFNCYNTGDVTFTLEDNMEEDAIYVGGIGGTIVNCKNNYNVGAVASSDLQYAHCGIIAGYLGSNSKNLYWFGDYDLPVYGTGYDPEGSCAFHSGATLTSWVLDEPQYGTTDLVEALNAGANAIEGLYPGLGPVSRWDYDMAMINGGFPVFENMAGMQVFNGSEWYYEILNNDGSTTYQHLEYAADTTIGNKHPKIIVRSNTHYDCQEITEVTHEYVYEENGKVYWWNKDLEEFTMLYDLTAQAGDEWEIKVGFESLTMHVDGVGHYEYEGHTFRLLRVSNENNLFSGDIVCGVGHLTSFFPEKLMNRNANFTVDGLRCYWIDNELVFKISDEDCDAIYSEIHGVEEDGPSTGSGTLLVYPNPANDILFVETRSIASQPAQTYRITNLMGQTVLSGSINDEKQQIDIKELPVGMYFITMGEQTVKFVVK